MKLAISNIAWHPAERARIHALLAELGVSGLEIAPGLTFPGEPDAFAPSEAAVAAFHQDLAAHGLSVVSMQSLLFGVKDAMLFGTPDERSAFIAGLKRAIALAARLGVPNLVMGSPVNRRIPDDMDRETALDIAEQVFGCLGDRCAAAGCRLALEPNPAAYGANFMTTIGETADVADRINHPAITVNFDLGSLHMNDEIAAVADWYARCAPRVSHVHISEPNLGPAPADSDLLGRIGRSLSAGSHQHWWSVEMRQADDDSLEHVKTAMTRCIAALSGEGRT